ncbi:hypothetical protein WJX81_000812 [Elliptochloris bilobata]|uniref:AB hydrolase-1 domain-containing protein n=1 Tax=Elliptochloris bilobata TaxID=381761 RepID=A0AAW1RRR1_9CHLO
MGLGSSLMALAGYGSVVFRPPKPTYRITEGPDGLAIAPTANARGDRKYPGGVVVRLQTARGGSIVAVLVEHQPAAAPVAGFGTAASAPFAVPRRPTILLSHGTAIDLGRVLLYYSEVAKDLRCNLCVYDYSGYGESRGSPSIPNTIADINAVFTWLTQQRGIRVEDIVLYGQSLGSGPTVDLACRQKRVAGIVLNGAFASGVRQLCPGIPRPAWFDIYPNSELPGVLCMRQLCPGMPWPAWLDIYPNSALLPSVWAPVCVLHGTQDKTVGVEAGRLLHSLARKPAAPYFPACGHEDVELSVGFVPHLRRFLEGIFGSAYGK